ncbi:hypothetical protein AVEN_14541-1 [Araneus ventricosus]|uniref:Uncharacterized protein n=1 Tax=Araneus ventricosus TaxID=182803 RepID=A0A4Y2CGZ9_ARAVE|nr:hypothetical protein AVEN_14541-1 [Araneus ventricosus]
MTKTSEPGLNSKAETQKCRIGSLKFQQKHSTTSKTSKKLQSIGLLIEQVSSFTLSAATFASPMVTRPRTVFIPFQAEPSALAITSPTLAVPNI